ncbi:MAG: ribonuclease P protein component [Planctomycetota bacterium]
MTDFKFPKTDRLLKKKEFDLVYANDAFAVDDVLVVKGIHNRLGRARLGLSIGKKVGNAVVRNRWKRLIRESFRLQKSEFPSLDIVVRPRKGSGCDPTAIFKSLKKLAWRLDKRLGSKR